MPQFLSVLFGFLHHFSFSLCFRLWRSLLSFPRQSHRPCLRTSYLTQSMSSLVGFFFLEFFFDLFSYLFSCLLALGCCLLYPLKPLTRQVQLFSVSVRSVNSPAAALPVRCVVVFLKTRFSSFSAFSSPSPVLLSSSLPLSSC